MAANAVPTSKAHGAWVAACIAALLAFARFHFFGDVNIDLSDEGFLWYGAQQTAAGEIPLRDFQSYEPGRYYWTALWSVVLGDGILALRLSTAIFQALGLYCGLLVARRLVSHPAWLIPIGIILILWMFPRHKLFESSLAMMAVFVGMRLLEDRSLRSFAVAGAFVGLAGFFGRNHALYSGLGITTLTLWLSYGSRAARGDTPRRLAALIGGGLIGSLPLIGMLLFVPGFAGGLWDSILFFVDHGANLPTPIPWPWRVDFSSLSAARAIRQFLVGLVFVAMPLIYGCGILVALRRQPEITPARIVLVAATAIGVFYSHHVLSRSDIPHLGQSIHPLLLASLAIPGALGWSRRGPRATGLWTSVLVISVAVLFLSNSTWALPWQDRSKSLVVEVVAGDELRLPQQQARRIRQFNQVVRTHVPPDEKLLIAPFTPGLYSVLNKKAPIWGLYLLWKADEFDQDAIIARLNREGVNWALIGDRAIYGDEGLRMRNSHPRVWRFFSEHFEFIRDPMIPRGFFLLHRRLNDHGSAGDGLQPQPLP